MKHQPEDHDLDTSEAFQLDCPNPQCPLDQELLALKSELQLLRSQAITDGLTGLFNKRYFDNSLLHELDRTSRTGQPTALLLLDIDHFKNLNDSHGHQAGDKVLESVARLLLSDLRRLDIACRYGGEEFAVILPSTPLLVAIQVAERIRQQIERSKVEWKSKKLHVTASIGVDCCQPHTDTTPDQLLAGADEQLYRAKRSGRNQVSFRPGEPATHVSSEEREALNQLALGNDQ